MSEKRNAPPGATGWRAGTGFAEQQSFTRRTAENQRKSVANQALAVPIDPMPSFEITGWQPAASPSALKGRVKLTFSFGLQITGVAVFSTDRGRWCQWPAEPQRDREGRPLRDANGKVKYRTPLAWVDKRDQMIWSNAVLGKLEAQFGADIWERQP